MGKSLCVVFLTHSVVGVLIIKILVNIFVTLGKLVSAVTLHAVNFS